MVEQNCLKFCNPHHMLSGRLHFAGNQAGWRPQTFAQGLRSSLWDPGGQILADLDQRLALHRDLNTYKSKGSCLAKGSLLLVVRSCACCCLFVMAFTSPSAASHACHLTLNLLFLERT